MKAEEFVINPFDNINIEIDEQNENSPNKLKITIKYRNYRNELVEKASIFDGGDITFYNFICKLKTVCEEYIDKCNA